VDGVEYAWEQRHGWVAELDRGLKGISISVWQEPARGRELILDFPFRLFGVDRRPPLAKLARAVEKAIPLAAAAGWEPGSRGRPFRYEVAAIS
jgi:hypothetical protein